MKIANTEKKEKRKKEMYKRVESVLTFLHDTDTKLKISAIWRNGISPNIDKLKGTYVYIYASQKLVGKI